MRIVAAFQMSANSIVIETYKTKVPLVPQSRRLKFGLECPEQFSYDASVALLKKIQ